MRPRLRECMTLLRAASRSALGLTPAAVPPMPMTETHRLYLREEIKKIFEAADPIQSSAPDFLVDLRRMQRFHGIFAAVARELQCSVQHVRHVAIGKTTSARVLAALEQHYRRIDNQPQQPGHEKGGDQ